MSPQIIEIFSQFGAAGLIGALWVWERWLSRRRERELDEAHRCILIHRENLKAICAMVRQNTQAIERFNQTQVHLVQILQKALDKNKCDAA